MHRAVIDHRSADFAKLGSEVLENLRPVFQTTGPVIIYPSSGTGAWEAAMVNTLSAGDRVLSVGGTQISDFMQLQEIILAHPGGTMAFTLDRQGKTVTQRVVLGETEAEAKEKGVKYEVTKFPWTASGRALSFDRTDGVTKMIVDPEVGSSRRCRAAFPKGAKGRGERSARHRGCGRHWRGTTRSRWQ